MADGFNMPAGWDDSEAEEMADDLPPPNLPKVDFDNHAVDPTVRGCRGGQTQYRRRLFSMLYDGSWMQQMAFSAYHLWFANWLLSMVMSEHQVRKGKKDPSSTKKVRICIEFILSVLTRCRDEHHLVPFCIAFSLYCYVNHVSGEVFAVLTFLRVCYNKDWVKKFAMEMAEHMPPPDFTPSKILYVESCDNDFFLMKVGLQRVGDSHKNIDVIQCVEHIQPELPVPACTYDRGIYIQPSSWQPLFRQLDPLTCFTEHLIIPKWLGKLESGEIKDVSKKPPGPVRKKTAIKYLRPEVQLNANDGNDVDTCVHVSVFHLLQT